MPGTPDAGLRIVGVHTGGFLPARVEENVRRAVERLEIPWPVAIDTDARGVGHLRQRGLARALPVGPRRPGTRCTRCTTARAGTSRPSSRSRRCWVSSATRSRRSGRRRPPTRWSRRRPPDQPGAYSGPTRRAACGSSPRARACVTANGVDVAIAEPGCYPLVEHPRHTDGSARAVGRRGRDRPRHLLHPRAVGLSSSWPRSPSRRTSRGGPSSSTITAVPGQ